MPALDYPNARAPGLPFTQDMPSSGVRDEDPRRRRQEAERDGDTPKTPFKKGSYYVSTSSKMSTSKQRSSPAPKEQRPDRQQPERDSSSSNSNSDRKVKGSTGAAAMPDRHRRTSSGPDARPRTSYPSFSKAHSREAVGSREDISKRESPAPESPFSKAHSREDISTRESPTPDQVDVEQVKEEMQHSGPAKAPPERTPPSPPQAVRGAEVRKSGSGTNMRKAGARSGENLANGRIPNSVKITKSGSSLRREAIIGDSEVSTMPGAFPDEVERKSTSTDYKPTVSTDAKPPSMVSQNTQTTFDSQATSVDPKRKAQRPANIKSVEHLTPSSVTEIEPKTPTPQDSSFPPEAKQIPVIDVTANMGAGTPWFGATLNANHLPTPPPPPPPPDPQAMQRQTPRVDYLLKNGGLPHMVPKKLVQAGPTMPIPQYSIYQSPGLTAAAPKEAYGRIFTSVHKRLDEYMQVLSGNGSMAVATGYRSVARRLLDKLSQIFARDISSQRCECVICRTTPQPHLSDDDDSSVSWGEILEFVSGRRELPEWPPFRIQPNDSGLGISGAAQAPMQKLDIDVPEEYRDHYIKQNKKTKQVVQTWLAQQPDVPSGPPEEADEDTLMFAMMTKLNPQQRSLFIALMHGMTSVPESRAPTPAQRPSVPSGALKRSSVALHRLYRLERPPRDCECAMYLLNNPDLHGMLATLAEVNEQEWEILVSGRFDGFLWSGAEDRAWPPSASQYNGSSRAPSRNQNMSPFSRNTTPFSGISAMASRGPTPFQMPSRDPTPFSQASGFFPSRRPTPGLGGVGAPAPVQLDEETEIAVLAEVERGIYTDMEMLEDAFEALHLRAEHVREMLRERSTGLSVQAQLRRGSSGEPWVRLDTPASGLTNFDEEDDDGLADLVSLAPDDSASNISYNRRQRRNERSARKTPAAVAEVDEMAYEDEAGRRKIGSRKR